MFKRGEKFVFIVGHDKTVYKALTDQYELQGRTVIDLEGYSGEVAVEYLRVVN